jgi:hypothetical protein
MHENELRQKEDHPKDPLDKYELKIELQTTCHEGNADEKKVKAEEHKRNR